MVARILWLRAFTGYGILVLLGYHWGTVDWHGNCNGDTHKNEWRGKTLDNGYRCEHY